MSFIFMLTALLLFAAYALATPRSARDKIVILAALVFFAVAMPLASQTMDFPW
jgi:4-amino-4-deoxy-L-arabinose transferase-like glycosyltransferase